MYICKIIENVHLVTCNFLSDISYVMPENNRLSTVLIHFYYFFFEMTSGTFYLYIRDF